MKKRNKMKFSKSLKKGKLHQMGKEKDLSLPNLAFLLDGKGCFFLSTRQVT